MRKKEGDDFMSRTGEPSIRSATAHRGERCTHASCSEKKIKPGERMDEYDTGNGIKKPYHPICLDEVLLRNSYSRDYQRGIGVERFPLSFTTVPSRK